MSRTGAVLLIAIAGVLAMPEVGAQGSRRRARPGASEPFATAGPDLGDAAPDLELQDLDGNPVRLSDLWSARPLILVLGSLTSAEFRGNVDDLERLGVAFGAQLSVVAVYTKEAHPTGSESPYPAGVAGETRGNPELKQAGTLEERRAAARTASEQLTVGSLLWLVDGMDDAAWKAYGPAPNTAFLIEEGYVALRQNWFDPVEMDRTFRQLLELRQAQPSSEPGAAPNGSTNGSSKGSAGEDG